MGEHTDVPWSPYSTYDYCLKGKPICITPEDYDHAVRCVNSFPALVSALEAADAWFAERNIAGTAPALHARITEALAVARREGKHG